MQTSGRATRRTIPNVTDPVLRIAHLYADEMNIYGDRGNILTLQRRAEWRGIPVEVRAIGRGPSPDLSDIDLIFWGGGQDRDQELVFTDAAAHKVQAIRAAIDGGAVVLAVCGGYQLLGKYYVTADGKQLPGLGLVDLHTVPGTRRNIGNIVIETSGLDLSPTTLVGLQNHSGKTYLGAGLAPLGRLLRETSSEPTCTAHCSRRTRTLPTSCSRERYDGAAYPVWNRWMIRWKCRRIAASERGSRAADDRAWWRGGRGGYP